MARAAGNSNNYRLSVLDPKGKPVGEVYEFPSVTTILDAVVAKPRLVHWYYTQGIKGIAELSRTYGNRLPTSDEAGLRTLLKEHGLSPYSHKGRAAKKGTSLHDSLEQALRGGPIPEHAGLRLFLEDHIPDPSPANVLAVETPLVSFQHRYAGTLDLVFVDSDGQTIMADLKTGKGIHWTHFLQQVAYREAWEEHGGKKIDKLAVLHVPSDGKTYDLKTFDIPFEVFNACLEIYRALPLDNWYPDDLYLDEEDK